MWPPVIWVGKWLLKEAVMTVVVHYGTKFVKEKLKKKDEPEKGKDENLDS